MEEKILTLHPQGKQGVNISKDKYETVRQAILSILEEQEEIRFQDLPAAVDQKLVDGFDGSITWYVTTVKLDLEARGLIVRDPKSSPQSLRLGS